MRRAVSMLLALGLLAALAGCQDALTMGEKMDPRALPEARAYLDKIKPYLSEGVIRRGPASQLLAAALPLTRPVREAMARREAAAYAWREAEFIKRWAQLDAQSADGLVVVLSVFTAEPKWNDLDSPRPTWRVFLVDADGGRHQPVDRRRIKERSALNEALYPFWGMWDHLYRLRFATQDAKYLVITGPPGETRIELNLG